MQSHSLLLLEFEFLWLPTRWAFLLLGGFALLTVATSCFYSLSLCSRHLTVPERSTETFGLTHPLTSCATTSEATKARRVITDHTATVQSLDQENMSLFNVLIPSTQSRNQHPWWSERFLSVDVGTGLNFKVLSAGTKWLLIISFIPFLFLLKSFYTITISLLFIMCIKMFPNLVCLLILFLISVSCLFPSSLHPQLPCFWFFRMIPPRHLISSENLFTNSMLIFFWLLMFRRRRIISFLLFP